jgi:hypothetical protein
VEVATGVVPSVEEPEIPLKPCPTEGLIAKQCGNRHKLIPPEPLKPVRRGGRTPFVPELQTQSDFAL